ncbi:unnamed protein product [Staurois parvus]|uniref:Uncharacterized protein n=1 Tax=Staurois parvus TaxID=386267 RepID=A0ABN9DUK4_9NEOB|nr:unnamed protein product [Staurois parvus]
MYLGLWDYINVVTSQQPVICLGLNLGSSGSVLWSGADYHLETRALPEGPGSVEGPMRCPWYLFHRLF